MSQATHPESVHYDLPDQRIKRRTANVGLSVLCVVLAAGAAFLGFKLNKTNTELTETRARLEQANRETADVKASLATSDTSLTNLRSQLDKAKKDLADQQAQAQKNQELGAGLQAQLDQSRSELQALQQKTQTESTDLQAQLKQANETSTGLRSQLDQAKSENEGLKTQLAKAKTDLANLQLPPVAAKATRPLPLSTEFKKSFFGKEFSLQLKNQGGDPLKLDIQVTGSEKTPSRSVVVEGNHTLKLDNVTPGATIVIASEGFEPVSLTAQ